MTCVEIECSTNFGVHVIWGCIHGVPQKVLIFEIWRIAYVKAGCLAVLKVWVFWRLTTLIVFLKLVWTWTKCRVSNSVLTFLEFWGWPSYVYKVSHIKFWCQCLIRKDMSLIKNLNIWKLFFFLVIILLATLHVLFWSALVVWIELDLSFFLFLLFPPSSFKPHPLFYPSMSKFKSKCVYL